MRATPSAVAFVAVFGALAGVVALDARQQPRDALPPLPTGTAVITGRVVTDDDSARPIRGASVTVSVGQFGAQKQLAVTDDDGRFAVGHLPAGEFIVVAAKPGYVDASYGARDGVRRGARAIFKLADGEQKPLALQLARGGVIAGRILDAAGHPQRDVAVRATRVKMLGDRRVLDLAPTEGRFFGMTDDSGDYRLYGLAPADYVVSATTNGQVEARPTSSDEIRWAESLAQRTASPGAQTMPAPASAAPLGYAPVFYPGASDPTAAAVVTLAKGEEREGVDFSMLPVALARIEGTLLDAGGRPVSGVEIALQSQQSVQSNLWFLPVDGGGIPASRTDTAGTFRFSRVLPGTYTLLGRRPTPSSWVRDTITVTGSDQLGVSLRLQPAVTVSGRLIFEGDAPPEWSRVRLNLGSIDGAVRYNSPLARIELDGTFVFRDIIPDRYRLITIVAPPPGVMPVSGPAQWGLKSLTAAGVDVRESGLDVTGDLSNIVATLTDRRSELSGTLVDAAGRPVTSAYVVAFSTTRSRWTTPPRHAGETAVDRDGRYLIAWLDPDEYFLAAVTDADVRQLLDVSFLESLIPRAIRITIAEAEKKTQNLKLSGGSPD